MQNTSILFIVSAVLFLIGAATILIPLFVYRRKAERCSETVEAVVAGTRYRQRVKRAGGTSSRPLYAPVYEYHYRGKKYTAEAGIARARTYQAGARVPVRVNPEEPKEILSEHDLKGYIMISLCGIFPLCFAIGVLVLAVTAA